MLKQDDGERVADHLQVAKNLCNQDSEFQMVAHLIEMAQLETVGILAKRDSASLMERESERPCAKMNGQSAGLESG